MIGFLKKNLYKNKTNKNTFLIKYIIDHFLDLGLKRAFILSIASSFEMSSFESISSSSSSSSSYSSNSSSTLTPKKYSNENGIIYSIIILLILLHQI